ncbi:Coatomer, alpha subunit [Suhomyces tanzawaensis NRRL Y-17324]|uniref:Coatomer subunit alpha n=1 Tax=Suhomyces tanzawaensis NRRL Y-17324 TaxID=984487 RepID=A0A1E4SPV1_9ASCO|nr:Coatomer, alpha subunit [Suhomyces tanzawaensis NRRL Y-17324]ODV81528.1 Coatomer, alpha subunit [Suhomyces tanzawaensis NRRL Y-17324]
MKMLTKFESKSSRAKGVAFHPKRPWVLVSLHSSTIQLWDYRMGTLIDRFEEHTGPVRCVDFHPTQPLFVSGGDDYLIKVWSLKDRLCIFTLQGHLDYIRTVSFHNELPWIISCSDDQTIRIWNWQNQQEIACLTGHNHYVMSAQFHPTDDLIVSASLDQTVRVWDISGLRKKHSAPTSAARSFEDQLQRQQLPQQDIFGNVNAIVKYVLEGHDKGVNWATFHPTLPLIVSAGDDRLVKLWRMSDTKAWEVDTCRGHTGNVLSAVFHPQQDLILSVSDDKTIRVWDLNKRVPIKQFRREHDRFWLITPHPTMNLFATCHDSGVMVFKLERERPAHALFQNNLFYVNSAKQLQSYDFQKQESSLPMLSLKKIGKTWSFMRTLSYNQADHSILVTHGEGDNGGYALISLPKHVTGAIEPTDIRQGEGRFACFISRNRFVTFIKSTKTLYVKDLSNNITKTVQLDSSVNDVLYGGAGRVLLVKSHSVINYDVQQRKELSELSVNNAKYVSASLDGQYLAFLSKHTITIADKDLNLITSMHETIRIKSAAWDDSGVLLYSTLNHIKYTLLNGDNGIIKTLQNTLYITKITNNQVYCLNRAGQVEVVQIDPTEFRFKKSLVNKNFGEVLRIIKNSNLVGQNIIGYLQKKGYPEIALQFVQDPETRFELALECSNLVVALEQAKILNNPKIWEKLGEEALNQGNLDIVEFVYQQLHHFDKLSFLYLLRGDSDRLAKMSAIAEHRGDFSSLLQNTLYNNDIEKRVKVYIQAGLLPLAYTLAKSNGLDELADEILKESGVDKKDVSLPQLGQLLSLPSSLNAPIDNWPLKESSLSYFENALKSGNLEGLSIEDKPEVKAQDTLAIDFEDAEDVGEFGEEDEADGGAWDLDDELDIDDDIPDDVEGPTLITNEGEIGIWLSNAKTPASYVAAGSVEQAASLLNKQLGVVNFEPLRSRFIEVYQASKLQLPGIDDLPAMRDFVRAENDEDDPSKFKPLIPGFDTLEERLQTGFKQFKENDLKSAISTFKDIIYTITVITVDDEDQEAKCKDILILCREYILGLSIELERRSLDPSNVKRNLELAAYFTRTKLQNPHKVNALQVAMTQTFKNKNYASASYFAGELLKIVSTGARAEQAQKLKTKADSVSSDAVEIDFDPYAEFDICSASYTPIYKGAPFVTEALVGAKYKPEYKGKVCKVTGITAIGVPASGLRIVG